MTFLWFSWIYQNLRLLCNFCYPDHISAHFAAVPSSRTSSQAISWESSCSSHCNYPMDLELCCLPRVFRMLQIHQTKQNRCCLRRGFTYSIVQFHPSGSSPSLCFDLLSISHLSAILRFWKRLLYWWWRNTGWIGWSPKAYFDAPFRSFLSTGRNRICRWLQANNLLRMLF